MKRAVVWAIMCFSVVVACSPAGTPTPTPAATVPPLATAAPIVATPPPGPTLVLHEYMRLVHERVLLEFARRVTANRELLSAASTRSFDADMLCPGPASNSWQHFADLQLEASVIIAPPLVDEFQAALSEALAVAEESAESCGWFCTTYASFGQPAEGMWGRLSLQVRACESRMADLRAEWAAMGGDALGLVW
jgi:hypothetical protein